MFFSICGALALTSGASQSQEFSGSAALRSLHFEQQSGGPRQILSLEFNPKLTFPLGETGLATIEALATRRFHGTEAETFDLQRAKLDFSLGSVDVTFGNDLVFLGVTEGAQLINVINQSDYDVDFTGKTKLGQLMLRFGVSIGTGRAEAFFLDNNPVWRTRNLQDRLGLGLSVDNSRATQINRPDDVGLALRYANSIGNFDLDFIAFKGINRTPALVPVSATELAPVYSDSVQFGMAAQWTFDNLIGKFELLTVSDSPTRDGTFARETLAALGIEVAQYGIFDSLADLTYVAELSNSTLGARSVNDYQQDLLLGVNLDFNDVNRTTLTAGLVHDLDTASNRLELTFDRRLSDFATIEAKYYNFSDLDPRDVEFGLRNDSVFEFAIKAFF